MDLTKRMARFIRYRLLRTAVWLRQRSLPGFEGISIWEVLKFVFNEIGKDDITTRANSAAYSFFISLFPSILFLLTLVPYFPLGQEMLITLEEYLTSFLPGDVGEFIGGLIHDLRTLRGGLLSFGFLAAIYFASNGMDGLMRGFEKHDIVGFRERNWIERRIVAIIMTLVLFFLMIFAIVMVIVGNVVLEYITERFDLEWVIQVLLFISKYVVVILVLYGGISFIYKFGPSLRRRSSFFSPGALLATIFSIISTVGFSYFIDNYGQYNQLYGAIGVLLIVMLWLQIICFVILVGFELNASIAVGTYRKHLEQGRSPQPSDDL